ncbi:MAG TPA: TonB-dependent receptor [Opitutaceae bacterium]|nr:TonB-dependent receptor [Opitutaceae bacterium]
MLPRRTRLRRFRQLAPLAGCAWLLTASAAVAAVGDEEDLGFFFDLPPFVVEGVRERPEPVALGDAITPAATSLAGAARQAAGMLWLDGGEGFYPPRIMARGSGLQSAPVSRGLLLRIDSLPLNAADGSFNLALLEPGFFGAFSFQPGAADSSAAVQALGGALDLSWWCPQRETHGDAMVTVGGDGFVHALVRDGSARTAASAPNWGAAIAYTRSDGWRPNGAQERLAAATRAEWPGLGGRTQSLNVYAVRADLRIPGPLTLATAEHAPDTITDVAAVDLPRRTTDYARLVYRVIWQGGFEAALGVQATDDEFRQLRANGIAATCGADVLGHLSGRWYLGRALMCEAGASGSYGQRTQQRYSNLAGQRGVSFAAVRWRAGTATGWCDANWKPLPQLTFAAGLSALAARREAFGTMSAAGRMGTTELAPHIEFAAALSARRLVEAFVRAERSVEAPTFDDLLAVRGIAPELVLGWTPLRDQTTDTLSAGLRGRAGEPGAERFSFALTAYTADWRHELLRLADAGGAARGTVNAGATRHRGFESQLRWRLLAGERTLDLAVTHTWSEARFAHDPVYGTARLAGLPPQVGAVQLSYAQSVGFFGALGARWVSGTTYADHADRLGFGGHTLANVKLGWSARRWSLAVEVENVFDRRHVASTAGVIDRARSPAATALFLPGRPRTFTGTFAWRW